MAEALVLGTSCYRFESCSEYCGVAQINLHGSRISMVANRKFCRERRPLRRDDSGWTSRSINKERRND